MREEEDREEKTKVEEDKKKTEKIRERKLVKLRVIKVGGHRKTCHPRRKSQDKRQMKTVKAGPPLRLF